MIDEQFDKDARINIQDYFRQPAIIRSLGLIPILTEDNIILRQETLGKWFGIYIEELDLLFTGQLYDDGTVKDNSLSIKRTDKINILLQKLGGSLTYMQRGIIDLPQETYNLLISSFPDDLDSLNKDLKPLAQYILREMRLVPNPTEDILTVWKELLKIMLADGFINIIKES